MIGVIPGQSPSARYLEEVLRHAGLAWQALRADEQAADGARGGVIVLAAGGTLPAETRAWLGEFVRQGGALVVSGGTAGLDELLGVAAAGALAEGYLTGDASHPVTTGLTSSLHVFGATRLRATTGTSLARLLDADRQPTGADAIVLREVGRGLALTIAADLPGSILRIPQGRSIDRDGVPAPDGTAPVDDGILKTDDGVVLSWTHDRERTTLAEPVPDDCPGKHPDFPRGDTPWFAQPIADELRVLLLRAIGWAATATGQALPAMGYWPRGLPAVGLISHDSDHNIDETARTTLGILDRAGIKSTWCNAWSPVWPGRYTAETHKLVKAAGHEIALHYNALPVDGGAWGEDEFRTQLAWLRQDTGVEQITSNKNHYLRWEGEVEFFRWLEAAGIACDQSKGPSKKGNVGYPHGSCQTWFPYDAEAGRFIDVLEIPLQTQDLWWTTPYATGPASVAQARKHHGVAHFLFHQVHLHRQPAVAQALLDVVAEGRAQGLEWWTSAQINDWARARRAISITSEPNGDMALRLRIASQAALAGATLTVLPPANMAGRAGRAGTPGGAALPARAGDFHGLPAIALDIDLATGTTVVDLHFQA
ncbi:MAG: hypothetical protein ACTHMU_04665 [Thermomicrobiales bacterium]